MEKIIEIVKIITGVNFLLSRYVWSYWGGVFCIVSLPVVEALTGSDNINFIHLAVSAFGIFLLFVGKSGKNIEHERVVSEKDIRYADMVYEKNVRIDNLHKSLKDLLNGYLEEIAVSLNFTDRERVSIYQFLPSEFQFECVARYSTHEAFDHPPSRDRYPSDNGIIASVWHDTSKKSFISDNRFPDFRKDPRGYRIYLRDKYGIKEKVSKEFTMNPKHIIAGNMRGSKSRKIAVIVFESQRGNFLQSERVKETYENNKNKIIEILLDTIRES